MVSECMHQRLWHRPIEISDLLKARVPANLLFVQYEQKILINKNRMIVPQRTGRPTAVQTNSVSKKIS
jgi:hypothetical protein